MAKNYNDDLNNKDREINELKNIMKEMEMIEKEDQNEINKLKRMLNDIKSFYKNGFNRFFNDENIDRSNFGNNLDIRHEISKKQIQINIIKILQQLFLKLIIIEKENIMIIYIKAKLKKVLILYN